MLIEKTIKAKVIDPTNRKREILEKEYSSFQEALHGQEANLYSATKQQAERFQKKIKAPKHKHYPVILRRDVIRLEQRDTKLSTYWFKFPCFSVKGGIWLALKPHCAVPADCSLREAKLIRHKNSWFIHLAIQKDIVEPVIKEQPILAVDLGERYLATICGSDGIKPQFLGKEARGVRRHYAWLRKRLEERKLLDVVKKVGHTEQRKVDAICHQISRQIVNEAKENDAVIVLGNLKGIRKSAKGKRMKRIVSNMPYFKLTQYIKYKALWDGVPVLVITEAYSSKTCHRCGCRGTRPYQGLFLCHSCNLRYSADLNGTRNHIKRAKDYMSLVGAALAQPTTQSLN
jgi:putative transposase